MAFPERGTDQNVLKIDFKKVRKNKRNDRKNSQGFCELHGACQHSTTSCQVIKSIQKKGFELKKNHNNGVRQIEKNVEDSNEYFNKDDEIYCSDLTCNINPYQLPNSRTNPFKDFFYIGKKI